MRNFRRNAVNNKYVPRDAKSRLAQKISSIKSRAARRFRAEEDEDEEEYDDDTFFFAGRKRSAENMVNLLTNKWENLAFYKEYVENGRADGDNAKFESELRDTFILLDNMEIGLDIYFDGGKNKATVGLILDEYDSKYLGYYNNHSRGRGILCEVSFKGGETDEAVVSTIHNEVDKAMNKALSIIKMDITHNLL